MNHSGLPELLAPAGNLEKLKIAFQFGADAVYVGGYVFGLRKYADNFSEYELTEGITLANRLGKKVYVVLNGFAHQADLDALEDHLAFLDRVRPHGLIISDMGVFQLAKRLTTLDLHVSTQASASNKFTSQFWKDLGAKRVILGRETSLESCREILETVDIELEIFVHGAMCASYSGKCVISNYSSGRDSNRGGCVQSCRHNYSVYDSSQKPLYTAHIMNAKDLNALPILPDIIRSGVCSLKIEGRMKSNMYLANTVLQYRKALDYYAQEHGITESKLAEFSTPLSDVSNRQFTPGALNNPLGEAAVNRAFGHYEKNVEFVGTVKAVEENVAIYAHIKSPFSLSDSLFALSSSTQERVAISSNPFYSFCGTPLTRVNPNSLIKLPWQKNISKNDVIMRTIHAQ